MCVCVGGQLFGKTTMTPLTEDKQTLMCPSCHVMLHDFFTAGGINIFAIYEIRVKNGHNPNSGKKGDDPNIVMTPSV